MAINSYDKDSRYKSFGNIFRRIRSVIFLFPAWFSPLSGLRVFFHRLRGVRIGRNVEIGYFCVIGNVHPHLIRIEDHAVVTVGSVLLAHDNAHYYTKGGDVKYGPVLIGTKAFIGTHSVVMPNVRIGECSIVAANSVVVRDVPAHTVVGGVPARIIKRHE